MPVIDDNEAADNDDAHHTTLALHSIIRFKGLIGRDRKVLKNFIRQRRNNTTHVDESRSG
jgi:hypothetical protein